ncbi:ABC transporter ATP-binding protein/permease [Phreatobacter oligotrophus]|uniref:Putative ATP-binding cassette transporter n=1 Tax=Phreatobacter oligotrophus TaxID=1122261 RepID=A0A2T4ZE76_9HYPH|nr:SbmA/BacA-like family transporter [Phreatobacter oligotrophus]PTM60187.1 putative ATP-binding cassette transporter [Phreatobacter oligotrophus]
MARGLADVWRLARLCALRPGGRLGIALFAAIFALGLAGIQVTIRLIGWTNDFYSALQRLDVPAATHQIGVFFLLVAISASLHLAAAWLRKLLQLRWRRTLTEASLDAWLAGRAYWHLRERSGEGLDNPDQRIAEDCQVFVHRLTTEALELMTNLVALWSYVAILWSLSTFPLSLAVIGLDLSVPRYMVWAAPVYVALATGMTHWLGRPLIGLNAGQQKAEADFRFALARLRENGEQVAFARGEAAERRLFDARFAAIAANWRQLMNRDLVLGLFTRPYMQTVLRIPMFLALPAFLAGRLTFGGLMQIASAFQNVVTTLSWFIFSYRDLAELFASARRLCGFLDACAEASGPGDPAAAGDGPLDLENLRVATPDGRTLFVLPRLTVAAGETVWLRAPSGHGKSTLSRVLAGLRSAEGRVVVPPGRFVFLPQQAYGPIGTIADAVAYPAPRSGVGDRVIAAALACFGLSRLSTPEGLDRDIHKAGLSGGEMQRLALARLVVQRPDWAVLDEATSALDAEAEAEVLATLRRMLPDAGLVLIAHRAPSAIGPLRRIDLPASCPDDAVAAARQAFAGDGVKARLTRALSVAPGARRRIDGLS